MTEAMPFLQKAILLSYAPRPFRGGYFLCAPFLLNLMTLEGEALLFSFFFSRFMLD